MFARFVPRACHSFSENAINLCFPQKCTDLSRTMNYAVPANDIHQFRVTKAEQMLHDFIDATKLLIFLRFADN